VILLDTSLLIDGLTGPKRSAAALRHAIESGERLLVPSLVLYEWLRGPRLREELLAQEALFPREAAMPFGPEEATKAAELYGKARRPRGGEIDLAIAACALVRDAALWTLNVEDFRDIPGLGLIEGRG
jgi:predicted nucleic acid-binding protein